MKDAVLSFIYPGVEKYLPQFLKSLSSQTDKDFKLFLVNDGVDNCEAFLESVDLLTEIKNSSGSPARLRKTGIEWVAGEGYEIIVFADSDDYFDKNRVLVAKELLRNNDIIFNELILFGARMSRRLPMFKQRFSNGERIGEDTILCANCLGLSNTAVRTEKMINFTGDIPDTVTAFDWAIYAKMLNAGIMAFFTNETSTYYRQHTFNIASPFSLTDEQILRGVKVKTEHYSALKSLSEWYSSQAFSFSNLLDRLCSDETFKQRYFVKTRLDVPANPLWWETIKSSEELKL